MIYSKHHLNDIEYIQIGGNYYAVRDDLDDLIERVGVNGLDRKRTVQYETLRRKRHLDFCLCVARRRRDLLFAGQSACVALGIPRLDTLEMRPNCISVTRRRTDIIHWRYGALDPDAKIVNGLLVTSPMRTVCDLAVFDSPESLLVSINHCLFQKMFSKNEFAMYISRRPGMKCVNKLKRILKLATPNCESPLETITLIAIHNAGFRMPQQQINLYDEHHSFIARVDMYWEVGKRRIVLELDGAIKYESGDEDVLYKEKLREDNIRDLDHFFVIRASWSMVKNGKLLEQLKKRQIPMRRYQKRRFICENLKYTVLNQQHHSCL